MRKFFFFMAALCCVALHAETLVFDCGVNGDNMWAELNTGSGALYLVGTGSMADYTNTEHPLWYDKRDLIKSIDKDSRSQYLSIGQKAFSTCPNLESVTLPNTVDSIRRSAFYGCTKLKSVNFPENLKVIDYYAFELCSALPSITLPKTLTVIGREAFYGCDGLTSVTIPASVTKVDWIAFGACKALTAINVDNNNANYCSLNGCLFSKDLKTLCAVPAGIEGSYPVPASVQKIDWYAFTGCKKITEIIVPQGVTSIKGCAFKYCMIKTMELPEGLTEIGDIAFNECAQLASITLPSTLKQIGNRCFLKCRQLTSVTCKALTPPTCDIAVFEEVDLTKCHLYVPESAIETYKNADQWKDFGDNIHAIGEGIEEVLANPVTNGRKVIYNGQVYVLQEGKAYTLTGTEIK